VEFKWNSVVVELSGRAINGTQDSLATRKEMKIMCKTADCVRSLWRHQVSRSALWHVGFSSRLLFHFSPIFQNCRPVGVRVPVFTDRL
jgi:hypothetical protein